MRERLRKVLAIARKDFGHYFVSPIGYIVLAVFFFVTGFFFYLVVAQYPVASMNPVFQNSTILLLFLTPMITMKLWAEEEKAQTAELLRTSPITLWDIVLGKYLAVCSFALAMISSTFVYLLIVVTTGNPDPGPVLTNYLGFALTGMAFFALGFLASTLSENQIVSAVIAYGILLMLWVIGAAGGSVQGPLGEFFKYLSIFDHIDDFMKGVIDLGHVVYFASLVFIGLFFSVKVLEGKRA
jgi:ABC-2 type transport system permease protein